MRFGLGLEATTCSLPPPCRRGNLTRTKRETIQFPRLRAPCNSISHPRHSASRKLRALQRFSKSERCSHVRRIRYRCAFYSRLARFRHTRRPRALTSRTLSPAACIADCNANTLSKESAGVRFTGARRLALLLTRPYSRARMGNVRCFAIFCGRLVAHRRRRLKLSRTLPFKTKVKLHR